LKIENVIVLKMPIGDANAAKLLYPAPKFLKIGNANLYFGFNAQGGVFLARTSHRPSAAVDSGMFTALRFLGLLDILSSMPAAPFVACLVSTPVCTASRQNTVRNAG